MDSSLSYIDRLLDYVDASSSSLAAPSKQGVSSLSKSQPVVSAAPSKHFYESLDTVVFDAIDGALATSPHLRRLNVPSDPSIKVVYRSDWHSSNAATNNKVALITGGGSGHEPCFFGYVGRGLLTASVCGEIFASPTTKSILYAILKVSLHNSRRGVLLLVGNYTGDVLNFSLAAKIAETTYGVPCRIIFLADDIALPPEQIAGTGARGVAGQVLVHKVAGYYAELGWDLERVFKAANEVNKRVGTVGVSAGICHHFGRTYGPEDELEPNVLELGLGVHGEPGFKKMQLTRVGNVLQSILKLFDSFLEKLDKNDESRENKPLRKDGKDSKNGTQQQRVVLVLNNLGSLTKLEMFIIQKYLLEQIEKRYDSRVVVERVFSGKFETSLDMKGFSVTLMKDVNDGDLEALDFDVDVPAWVRGQRVQTKTQIQGTAAETDEVLQLIRSKTFAKDGKDGKNGKNGEASDQKAEQKEETLAVQRNMCKLNASQADLLKLCVTRACEMMVARRDELNKLDAMVGDGDCGSTLEFGAKLVLEKVQKEELRFDSLVECFEQISQFLSDMGGSSGALYGYLLICASKRCGEAAVDEDKFGINVSKALRDAVNDLSEYSRAKRNDRTMLDALIPAVEGAVEYYEKLGAKADVQSALQTAAKAANEGCEGTRMMKAKFGRSSYVASETLSRCVDPGAKAVALWIESLAQAVAK